MEGDGDPARALSSLRKRRGVVRASITRVETKVRKFEADPTAPDVGDSARVLLTKLESLDKDFQAIHNMKMIDLTEDDLEAEVEALGEHEDEIANLSLRIRRFITNSGTAESDSTRKMSSRKLSRLERSLNATQTALNGITEPDGNIPLLEQHREQLTDLKRELAAVNMDLVSLDLEDNDALVQLHAHLEQLYFTCSLCIKELVGQHTAPSTPALAPVAERNRVKLPKLEVPTFDGNILHWRQFWEQFTVSVHDHSSLSDSERLVYLQQAIKNGSARNAIEGLSQSGDNYQEAVDTLKARYDRPRLTHRAHVRTIMETPPLKDGSGKELRRFHDTIQQHLRALKAMSCEPDGSFVTSVIELKLDADTLFEWSKHSQNHTEEVPPYQEILDFIDLRAQASETSLSGLKKHLKNEVSSSKRSLNFMKAAASFAANTDSNTSNCVLCPSERHPLYVCSKFKSLSPPDKMSTLKKHNLCVNCLSGGHYARQCKSSHKCKKCQRLHHTLVHVEPHNNVITPVAPTEPPRVTSNTAVKLQPKSLLMTCRVLVTSPDGSSIEARALLDNGSTVSFVAERLVQSLRLPRSHQYVRIAGIAGASPGNPIQSIASLQISPAHQQGRKIGLSAVVLPKVTCDLPVYPVPFDLSWNHISDVPLADPAFGEPGRIDLLLGVSVFVDVLLDGRRTGPPGSPTALETEFGWVLCGEASSVAPTHATVLHASTVCSDDILRSFWEIEEPPKALPAVFSLEERAVMRHFDSEHRRSNEGRYEVPLPRKSGVKPLGESRSQAVRRFFSLERSLRQKNRFQEVDAVVTEYFSMGHAEAVPPEDSEKPTSEVFYLPMHVVYKDSSTTTKTRAVFDASAKSSSGISLNDTLLVGPTVHPPLLDVLLRFRIHRIALTADVSKMYRAVELTSSDRDFHRFVWRSGPQDVIKDFRMTRATFGVSASCFAASMAVRQNAINHADEYPMAAQVVEKSIYVDDCLTGADDVPTAVALHKQLLDLFSRGCFLLRKWNASDPDVLNAIPSDLHEHRETLSISDVNSYTKTLGVNWSTGSDTFHITISDSPPPKVITKRVLASDVAKVFDILGWFAPATVSMKILLQRVWELGIGWDDPVPDAVHSIWSKWRIELPSLSAKGIPRCYFPKQAKIVSTQLHGFSDASEDAYAGVVFLRMVDVEGSVHISLVMSKTRVSPIKRLTIPRLELCGAEILARLLHHVREILSIPLSEVYAWTDSTVVLSWLTGNPRRFKPYVGNRVCSIVDLIPPDRWSHVPGTENPADCASRGLSPLELLQHALWWEGPQWLSLTQSCWPKKPDIGGDPGEVLDVCMAAAVQHASPLIPYKRYSSYLRHQRVMAWIFRFIRNCRHPSVSAHISPFKDPHLTVSELAAAENYLVIQAQQEQFLSEISSLKGGRGLRAGSNLLSLAPFIDSEGVLRVGGRERQADLSYSRMHPIILHGTHPLTKLLICSEHQRLLHAGPTLVSAALTCRFHIIGLRKSVRSITRQCVTCRRSAAKPQSQLFGQLPLERVSPGAVFEKVGLDYAGPLMIKYGMVRKPVLVKAYVCVFVSLAVKAVHLEVVSDLTSEAFIAALRRFVARRGYPSLIWSDHGTNFVGANRELRELHKFLIQQSTEKIVSEFCTSHKIEWRFIPEHGPHFGGLWEAAVKSTKFHLRRIVGGVRLTFEELTTVLTQVEACLNSRPLVATNPQDDDGIEVLTPGHFLVGHPLCALPDPAASFRSVSLLRRWHLCQNLVQQFWQRWSSEYLTSLNKINKWHHPSRNLAEGDIVVLREDGTTPTKWPLGKVVKVYPGKDNLTRVASVQTAKGVYKRPITKVALLLPITD